MSRLKRNVICESFLSDCDILKTLLEKKEAIRIKSITWYDFKLMDILENAKYFFDAYCDVSEENISKHGFYRIYHRQFAIVWNEPNRPTVWFLPCLNDCEPILGDTNAILLVEKLYKEIKKDYLGIQELLKPHPDSEEVLESGTWEALFLVSPTIKGDEFAELCPAVFSFCKQISVCNNFGFVSFNKTTTGTIFKRHTGSTNLRFRHHMGLIIPSDLQGGIEINASMKVWAEGKCIAFDDSLPHMVIHSSGGDRVVFSFDTWHPALSFTEVEILSHPIFQRFGKVYFA